MRPLDVLPNCLGRGGRARWSCWLPLAAMHHRIQALEALWAWPQPAAEKAARDACQGAHRNQETKPFLPVLCLHHPLLIEPQWQLGGWGVESKGSSPFTEQAKGKFGAEGHYIDKWPSPSLWWLSHHMCFGTPLNWNTTTTAMKKTTVFMPYKNSCPSYNRAVINLSQTEIQLQESCVRWYLYICCSVTKSPPTLCDPMICSTPGSSGLYYLPSLLEFMSIESVMLSNHLILCCPLLLPSIFAFPPPVDHILSELFTMTHLSWVALHLMAHSFNELCKLLRPTKAVIHEGASYIYYSTNQSQPHWILCSLKTLVVELTR